MGLVHRDSPSDVDYFERVVEMALYRLPLGAGQPEVVKDGISSSLWNSLDDFRARTLELMVDAALRRRISEAARRESFRFSGAEFKRRMLAALLLMAREPEGVRAAT